MIFHIPGLGHTQTTSKFVSCAFTQKVHKLCRMLTEAGHTVYHYGVEGSDPVCTENVAVVTNEMRRQAYPDNEDFRQQYRFQAAPDYDRCFDLETAAAIRRRVTGPGEFLLCAWGLGHKPIADLLEGQIIPVESGIGYVGTFARFRVFESAFHMAWTWGREGRDDGDWWSTVIPNYVDVRDFRFRSEKSDYLLYLGRLVRRKGVELAAHVARETGHRLLVCGQGKLTDEGMDISGDHVEYAGPVDVESRRELLAHARALLCPTYYIEPFGGVAVEAQMSGTPVICTDWGGFRETVADGVTGFRCSTFAQFCDAVERLPEIDARACRERALTLFSCDAVTPQYESYFERILRQGAVLEGADWYSR